MVDKRQEGLVWRALKKKNCQTFLELRDDTQIPDGELQEILTPLVEKGFIELKDGKYSIVHILFSLPKYRHVDWKYPGPMRTPDGGLRVDEVPAAPVDPNDVAQIDQGNIGSCVGGGGAYMAQRNYVRKTGDIPTDEERKSFVAGKTCVIEFDKVDDNGFRHDHRDRRSISNYGAYIDSREEGQVWQPEGSYPSFMVRAWMKKGVCWENQWPSGKDPGNVYDKPPDEAAARAEALNHTIDGYAQAPETFDELQAAINQKGEVLLGFIVWSNYTQMGSDGTFPEKGPNDTEAGGHCENAYKPKDPALQTGDYIYLDSSWKNWRTHRLSRNYINNGGLIAGENYVILDSNEVVRTKRQFVTSLVTVNVPAEVYVDGALVGESPNEIKVSLEIGRAYRVYAISKDPAYYNKGIDVIPTGATTEIAITLSGEPNPDNNQNWFAKILAAILEWIKKWLGRVKNALGFGNP